MPNKAPPVPPAAPEIHNAQAISTDSRELDSSLVRGIAWTGSTRWLAQIIQWASTLLVARILAPDDYGLVGMAMVFIGLVSLFAEFGIGSAIITLRNLSRQQIAQLNTVALAVGAAGLLVSCVGAIPLGAFFDASRLPLVIVVISSGFVIGALKIVPLALLQRELRFKLIAIIQMCQVMAAAASALTFALLGFGYWTLVLAEITSATVATILAVSVRSHPFSRPDLRTLEPALTFSRHILLGRLSWFVYAHADMAIAGRVLGQTALGFYSFAASLASAPVDKITEVVHRVTPAVFSSVQKEPAKLRRYLLHLTAGIALVVFPATIGLGLVARDFVLVVLGQHWSGMIAPLQVLAFYAAFRSVTPLLPQVLIVIGETRFAMRAGMAAAGVLPFAFYVGSSWGTTGIAAAWALVHPLVVLPLFVRTFRRIDLRAVDYFRAIVPAASATMLMAIAVLLVGMLFSSVDGDLLRLVTKVIAGAVTYVAVLVVFHRQHVSGYLRTIRLLRDRVTPRVDVDAPEPSSSGL